ncbi:MAG: hypothetical protein IT490_04945 [Candidatus Contendobacter sp.]|nr:hypothetical protein [Candidatus Contendobacter sp.]
MTDRFLPDYGLFLLSQGVQPGARLVVFDVPIDHITRPALRTISVTLSIEEPGQHYAMSFDFIGPRIDELLAVFPEPAREALWQWLDDRTTVGEHLQLSPTATVAHLEATLGAIQRGAYEQFVPLIVQRVMARP